MQTNETYEEKFAALIFLITTISAIKIEKKVILACFKSLFECLDQLVDEVKAPSVYLSELEVIIKHRASNKFNLSRQNIDLIIQNNKFHLKALTKLKSAKSLKFNAEYSKAVLDSSKIKVLEQSIKSEIKELEEIRSFIGTTGNKNYIYEAYVFNNLRKHYSKLFNNKKFISINNKPELTILFDEVGQFKENIKITPLRLTIICMNLAGFKFGERRIQKLKKNKSKLSQTKLKKIRHLLVTNTENIESLILNIKNLRI